MPQIKWTERTFKFDFPAGLYPELIERLRGTPARVADRLTGVDPSRLNRRRGSAWSILENIGHLADLDDGLFLVRLDEYQRGVESLQPADMTNRMTEEADHNRKSLEDILLYFRKTRAGLVSRLGPVTAEQVCLHLLPRKYSPADGERSRSARTSSELSHHPPSGPPRVTSESRE